MRREGEVDRDIGRRGACLVWGLRVVKLRERTLEEGIGGAGVMAMGRGGRAAVGVTSLRRVTSMVRRERVVTAEEAEDRQRPCLKGCSLLLPPTARLPSLPLLVLTLTPNRTLPTLAPLLQPTRSTLPIRTTRASSRPLNLLLLLKRTPPPPSLPSHPPPTPPPPSSTTHHHLPSTPRSRTPTLTSALKRLPTSIIRRSLVRR